MPAEETRFVAAADVQASVRDRLAARRAEQEKRDAEARDARELAELELFDLRDRFERETGGKVNQAFVIVDATELGEGYVVIKLGPNVLWKTFQASKMNIVDMDQFVVPCLLHPSAEKYRDIVHRRELIADTCTRALANLYGFKAKVTEEK